MLGQESLPWENLHPGALITVTSADTHTPVWQGLGQHRSNWHREKIVLEEVVDGWRGWLKAVTA